jgi:Flp pilus assembly protein TadD
MSASDTQNIAGWGGSVRGVSVARPMVLALTLSTALWILTAASALAVEGYNINAGEDFSDAASAPERTRFINLSGPGNAAPATYPVAPQAPMRMMPATSAIAPSAFAPPPPAPMAQPAAPQRIQAPAMAPPRAAPMPYPTTATPLYPTRARPMQNPAYSPVAAPAMYPGMTPAPQSATRVATPAPMGVTPIRPPVRMVPGSATTATATAPVIQPPPTIAGTERMIPSPIASAPVPPLSSESKQILNAAQPALSQRMAESASKVDIRNVDPAIADVVKRAEATYESAGVKISVASAPIDEQRELQRAYDALMEGETGEALRIYKDILRYNPRSEDALFGLAATYHRSGQPENARPLYGQLLKINPSHREGLNNMMALAASEAPQEALDELSRMERRFPDYSPIPAQMAVLLDKLGQPELARSKMTRAIALSPENWVYKYNFAIMLDRQGALPDAAALYKDILSAGAQGEKIPVDTHALQERLNYIAARLGNVG